MGRTSSRAASPSCTRGGSRTRPTGACTCGTALAPRRRATPRRTPTVLSGSTRHPARTLPAGEVDRAPPARPRRLPDARRSRPTVRVVVDVQALRHSRPPRLRGVGWSWAPHRDVRDGEGKPRSEPRESRGPAGVVGVPQRDELDGRRGDPRHHEDRHRRRTEQQRRARPPGLLCNAEMSKAILGGTLGSDAGTRGARSLGEVHERNELMIARADAAISASTLRRDLLRPMVEFNFGPSAPVPSFAFAVDPAADLDKLSGTARPLRPSAARSRSAPRATCCRSPTQSPVTSLLAQPKAPAPKPPQAPAEG